MKNNLFQIVTFLLFIFSFYLYIQLEKINNKIAELSNIKIEIISAKDNALENIDLLNMKLKNELQVKFRYSFNEISESIIEKN